MAPRKKPAAKGSARKGAAKTAAAKKAAPRARSSRRAAAPTPTIEETSGYSVVYRPVYREPENIFTRFSELAQRWLKESGLVPYAALGALVVFCLLALWTGFQPLARDPASLHSPNAQLQSMFRSADELNRGERISMWSSALRDNPKLLSWLEDASARVKNDNAPYIPEAFDCTTFVETVAALARSSSPRRVADNIIAIRYKDGEPSWFTRNHFPEADWIPNNVDAGILRDITASVARRAGLHERTVSKVIHKKRWFEAQADYPARRTVASRGVMGAPRAPEDVSVTLPYIPLENVQQAIEHVPTGTVVNIVHADSGSKPVLISHQGFIVKRNGKAYFRHARRTHGIKDSPFASYMRSQAGRSWRVVGINLNEIR